MTARSYYELLRDPRWQRKRLEIMERDGWKCRECRDASTTLNVHHDIYIKGRKPWEYEDRQLRTLCEPCHKRIEDDVTEIRWLLGAFGPNGRQQIIGYLMGLIAPGMSPDGTIPIGNETVALGIADALAENSAARVLSCVRGGKARSGDLAALRSTLPAAIAPLPPTSIDDDSRPDWRSVLRSHGAVVTEAM